MQMRMKDDIYYRHYGEYTYVRSVTQRKDYLFNDIVYDILNYIEINPGCHSEELIAALQKEYETEGCLIKDDIEEFICTLFENEIVSSGETEANINRIGDIIHDFCSSNGRLMSVCLELTYRCNERCIHCYIDDRINADDEMRFVDYELIIDELTEMGCLSLLITGGEPTLHPDFLDIVRYAKKKRMLVNIYTNGLAVTGDLLDELIELQPNSISFSFYGGTASVHDGITGVPGSFEKSIGTLLLAKARGIDVFIKTVLMKQNIHDYENLLKLAKYLDVAVESTMSVMWSHSGIPADRFRLMDIEAYKYAMRLEQKYASKVIDETSVKSDYICGCGRSALSINPYGSVYPCNAYPYSIGHIYEKSIGDIWNRSEELERIRSLTFKDLGSECTECGQREWCTLCLGSAIRENGRAAKCADTCMITEALKEYTLERKMKNEEI